MFYLHLTRKICLQNMLPVTTSFLSVRNFLFSLEFSKVTNTINFFFICPYRFVIFFEYWYTCKQDRILLHFLYYFDIAYYLSSEMYLSKPISTINSEMRAYEILKCCLYI